MEKLWERFFYSLEDSNGQTGLRRLVNNAETMASYFETADILTEARNTLADLKRRKRKLNLTVHDRNIDNILVYVFLKGITTIPSKTKAYKLGLIDRSGMLIKDPETPEEHDSLSNLDLLLWKLRDWLKPKMSYLSSVNWLNSINKRNRLQNYLLNTDAVTSQYVIRKINSELADILRKH